MMELLSLKQIIDSIEAVLDKEKFACFSFNALISLERKKETKIKSSMSSMKK